MLYGYARVSTGEQVLDSQLDALRAHGCGIIFQEHASGADRTRPELARALTTLKRGDTLVVVKIDRVARSLSHLFQVVECLDKRGVAFKSIGDPGIDMTTSHGRLMLGVLGSVAEFERSLIRDRTNAGLAAARARGRVGGNPALRTPEGQQAMAAHRRALAPPKAPAATPTAPPDPLLSVVAGVVNGRSLTLRQTGAALAAAGVAPASGAEWAPATVRRMVARARRAGLIEVQKQRPAEGQSQPAAVAIAAE